MQPEDKEMKWIDVQDQLPKDYEIVWIAFKQHDCIGGYYKDLAYTPGYFTRELGWRLDHKCEGKVQYWMPILPTPIKAEARDAR